MNNRLRFCTHAFCLNIVECSYGAIALCMSTRMCNLSAKRFLFMVLEAVEKKESTLIRIPMRWFTSSSEKEETICRICQVSTTWSVDGPAHIHEISPRQRHNNLSSAVVFTHEGKGEVIICVPSQNPTWLSPTKALVAYPVVDI